VSSEPALRIFFYVVVTRLVAFRFKVFRAKEPQMRRSTFFPDFSAEPLSGYPSVTEPARLRFLRNRQPLSYAPTNGKRMDRVITPRFHILEMSINFNAVCSFCTTVPSHPCNLISFAPRPHLLVSGSTLGATREVLPLAASDTGLYTENKVMTRIKPTLPNKSTLGTTPHKFYENIATLVETDDTYSLTDFRVFGGGTSQCRDEFWTSRYPDRSTQNFKFRSWPPRHRIEAYATMRKRVTTPGPFLPFRCSLPCACEYLVKLI